LGFKTLDGVVIPYGAMEAALQRNASVYKEYLEIVNGLNGLSSDELDRALSRLRAFIERLPIDEAIISQIRPLHDVSLMVRSSANCEDLARMAGAGLYDSIPNVTGLTIGAAIGKVWASLWTKRVAISRKQSGIAHQDAHIAVLIQPMIAPDYSFILHTANPMSGNRDEIYIELAVGAGEMLASASEPGVPFRMVCHLSTEKVETLSFSSFSHALRPGTDGKLSPEPIDYRKINLFHDHGARDKLTTKIATIGKSIEKAFGYPQDIEGCVLGDSIYVVQTRDQQGLND
jgi:phosphoglucan,water dikinase